LIILITNIHRKAMEFDLIVSRAVSHLWCGRCDSARQKPRRPVGLAGFARKIDNRQNRKIKKKTSFSFCIACA
jgi:hypothetical protein